MYITLHRIYIHIKYTYKKKLTKGSHPKEERNHNNNLCTGGERNEKLQKSNAYANT